VIAWTSFVVDTRTSKVYSVANGGHQDYSGNEVDVLDLERDQPVWSEILPPTPSSQVTNCTAYYSDDRPAARHTYYGVTFNELDDRFMLFTGAGSCDSGAAISSISSYNIGANTYSPSTTHGSVTSETTAPTVTFTANPSTGDVYSVGEGATAKWTRSTNTFANLSPGGAPPNDGYGAMAAFDTSRGRAFFLGGRSSIHHIYTPSSNTFAQVTLSGANASNVSGAVAGAMTYVAAIDRFLIRLGGAAGTVYQVDPSTFAVTSFTTTGGASVPATQNGPYNKFLYVPRLRGAVYVPSYSGNAWFLRLHTGAAGAGVTGVTGAVDSSLLNRHQESANLVYAFDGFSTTSGTPVAKVPVTQNSGGCTFSYKITGLPDGNYTVALTSDSGASFSRSANVTVAGIAAVQDLTPTNVVRVGPGQPFTHPNDVTGIVQSGDVVEIDAGTYTDTDSTWTTNNLTLRGVGGRVHLVAPATISNEKAIWVTAGANMAVENIEFSDAAVPDLNGAGIRAEGRDLAICGSYFHDNQEGILGNAGNGNILIEYSEFARNGNCDDPSACAHNMYIGNTDRFTLRYSYSHHAHSGHTVKSRAKENYILYNRIMDENTGDSSYLVDLPNGGLSYVIGNLIQKGPLTENSGAIVTYGEEGLSNTSKMLYVVNNTIVNDYGTSPFVVIAGGSDTALVQNNLFVGTGNAVSGPATQVTNQQTSTPNLVDRAGFDYRPTVTTPGIDQGTAPGLGGAFSLTPIYQYAHPLSREPRLTRNAIDVGAYEYNP
jgi:hypothetical protein